VARNILDLLAELLPFSPTEGLDDMPDALEPLGLRLRVPELVAPGDSVL